jgi:hypothetical protein
VPLLQRSDHPALEPVFTRLTALQDTCAQRDVDEIVATARFRFANLVFNEDDAVATRQSGRPRARPGPR